MPHIELPRRMPVSEADANEPGLKCSIKSRKQRRTTMNRTEMEKQLDGIRIISDAAEKQMYSHDIGDLPSFMTKLLFRNTPDSVVQPKSIDEIVRIMKYAASRRIPVVARGAASWGFGGVIPVKGGIVIDLSPFRRILSIDVVKKTVTVEAGARWSDIDKLAKQHGLCLMTYPSSKFSTVGGWLATGGYGINSFRYGHVSKQVESVKAVTASGEVKHLTSGDVEFGYLISSEGVFGILVEATIKLRSIPAGSYPHLLYFPSDRDAFTFIKEFTDMPEGEGMNPSVIRFLDENHMDDTDKTMKTGIFRKSAGVLMEFSTAGDDDRFMKYVEKKKIEEAPRHAARYLWNERLFGMKAKRLGPTILASETIISLDSAAEFIEKAKKTGSNFGVEVSIDSYILNTGEALIMATFLCDSRELKYYMDVPLVSILTKTALTLGAKPYGLGLWNAAFINQLFSKEKKRRLEAYKAKADPGNILNPGKFFSAGSKGFTGLLFRPAVFSFLMRLMIMMSPVLGKLVTMFLGKDKKVDRLDYELSLHACARCGSCLADCPAYLVTGKEAVTAKGKIAFARKLLAGGETSQEEAWNAFMCLHCKACEEVCQVNLDLMSLWDALEEKVESRFSRPKAEISEFLRRVDESREYWDMVETKSFPAASRVETEKEHAEKISHQR